MWISTVGWVGALITLCAYGLLISENLTLKQPLYHWLNLIGGTGVALNSFYYGAFPSVFTNLVWISITFYGLYKDETESSKNKEKRKKKKRPPKHI